MPGNKAVGITRHVEHFHSRLARKQLFCQHPAVHTRHDDIGKQEIKFSSEACGQFQGLFTVLCRQHTESAAFKKGLRQLSQGIGVLHQKNGFRAAQFFSGVGYRRIYYQLTHMLGEINLKGRTLPQRTVHPNIAVALLNDAVHRGKPQPRTFAPLLGGEKGFKDVRERSSVHARPRVGHRQYHVASNLGTRMVPGVGLVQLHIAGLDFEFAAHGHGVARVNCQVHDDLLDLALVGFHVAQLRIQRQRYFDVFSQQPRKHFFHIGSERVEVEDRGRQDLLSAER